MHLLAQLTLPPETDQANQVPGRWSGVPLHWESHGGGQEGASVLGSPEVVLDHVELLSLLMGAPACRTGVRGGRGVCNTGVLDLWQG